MTLRGIVTSKKYGDGQMILKYIKSSLTRKWGFVIAYSGSNRNLQQYILKVS